MAEAKAKSDAEAKATAAKAAADAKAKAESEAKAVASKALPETCIVATMNVSNEALKKEIGTVQRAAPAHVKTNAAAPAAPAAPSEIFEKLVYIFAAVVLFFMMVSAMYIFTLGNSKYSSPTVSCFPLSWSPCIPFL